jgi:NADH-quinone oxidoreductase subunit C
VAENSKVDTNVVGGRPAAADKSVVDKSAAADKLRAWSANAISEVIEFRGETTIVVPRNVLRDVAERCRADKGLQFNLLSDATCVDRYPLEPRFEVNYHLVSIPRSVRLRLQVRLSSSDPVVDSLVSVWPGANWLEREIFDLMGIRFEGHPDLRRILMPDDWEGYPLRRDYPVEGYRDIPGTALRYTRNRS